MFSSLLRIFLRLNLCVILIFLSDNLLAAKYIEGYVFVDSNKNSIMDSDEEGLYGVMVSNQKDVLLTDEDGKFRLKLIEGNYIFVTKPEAYQFKLDEYNNPEFYFLYKTKKTKETLKYPGAKIISEIPETLYFPLYENQGEEEYTGLLVGDPQMRNEIELRYYREGVIPHLAAKKADFYIELGDIAFNFLQILSREKQVSKTLGIPGYRVFGNHDINYSVLSNEYASETFKKVYGPDYYSFDYGRFHYIILLSHLPLHENFMEKSELKSIFKLLEKHKKILAVSGHLHTIVAYDYTISHGWKGSADFEGLVAGAVCGSWWSGVLGENKIPSSICTDGSPKGFFQLKVKEDDYNYSFHSVDDPMDLQFRTYINNDELWVNWFVGKKSDSVWVHIDDNPQAIHLQNFNGQDLLVESNYNKREQSDVNIHEASITTHLWKVKLPKGLKAGDHSISVTAKDSKGILFSGVHSFYKDK